MQFVLLVCLSFAIKLPGNLGNWATLDGGGDPDGISSTDAQQVICHHIDVDGRWNCQDENIGKMSVTETNKRRVILYVRVKHTLDVFNQNLAGAGARVRFANIVYSNDPEAVAFQLTETRHSELSGGVQGVWVVHLHPVRFPFILDLNDVALNGTSTVPLWWLPGQSDTVLCLISNHRSSRHAGRS